MKFSIVDKHHYVLKTFLFFLASLLFSNIVPAQKIIANENKNTYEDKQNIIKDSLSTESHLEIFRFTLENLFRKIPFTDTILDNKFEYYNPLDTLDCNIIDKGYLGSSAIILGKDYFEPGFDLGIHQYDFYNKTNKKFSFYKSNVPFASLFFSPGSSVQEFWTQAKFTKNFEDVNITLDYGRMISNGFYLRQNTKHSSLNLGVWKGDIKSKFNTFLNFLVNIHQEENNGGVSDTTFYKYSYNSIRENVPVKLDGSVSRLQDYSLTLNEFYKMGFRFLNINPYLHSGINGSTGFYKFYDENTGSVSDSIYYQGLLVDDIGLRNYISFKKYGVFGGLYFLTQNANNFQVGLDYQNIEYNIEPLSSTLKNLFHVYLKGNYSFLDNKISVLLDAKYFLLDYAGEYLLNPSLIYKNKYFNFSAGLNMKRTSPALIFQKLYLSKKQVYSNDFNKVLSNIYYVGIEVPKLGFNISFENKNYRDFLYYDSDLFPKQSDEKIVLNILKIKEEIRFLIFNLDIAGYLYNSNSIKWPLPRYALKSKIFVSPKLYKGNLFLKTGFEFNYWDKFLNYGYNPAIAGYYIQDKVELDNYMKIDYFVSAKIKSFLIFARANNLMFLWDNRVFYKVVDYPQNDFLFRVGVKWTLLN